MSGRFHQLLLRFAALFRRESLDRDLEAEMAQHLELAIEENLKAGMSPDEARRKALIRFGGTQQAKEIHRDARGLPRLETFLDDMRFAFRLLRKSPAFTIVAVLTLALGIGATTAIFSVVYGVLLRPLPYKNPNQIVQLWEQNATGGRMRFAEPNFYDLRAENHSLSAFALYGYWLGTVTGRGDATRIQTATVSRDFFQVMGVQPVVGREFAPEEQKFNAPTAALVSCAYWKQALGSTQDLSSIHLKIDNKPASVVGVLPPGFGFPEKSDIWLPKEIYENEPSRTGHNWSGIARLRDEVSLNEARAELSGIAARLKQQYGEDTAMVAVAVVPLREAMTSDVRPALILLLGASGFLLLIACANVTNLMLAQATSRERELAIRAALGADRSRLMRQFLTESFLLSAIGGALGVLLAYWGLQALLALAPGNLPRLDDVSLSGAVLMFSLATVLVVSMTMALFTALRTFSEGSREALSEGNRGGIGTLSKQRMGRMIAAGQLAVALVLLVGASLLGRSLLRVLSVDSGFRKEGIATMELGLPMSQLATERVAFLDKLVAQLRTIPGVEEVGGVNELPLSGAGYADGSFAEMNAAQISPKLQDLIQRSVTGDFEKDPELGHQLVNFFNDLFRDKSRLGYADHVVTSAGYFKALDIPLLRGRVFDDRDTIDAPHVAVISQSLAKVQWPNEDPIGRTVEFGNMDGDLRLLTVVGVVGDVRDHNLESAPLPTLYVDYRQRPKAAWRFTIVMRTAGNPETVFAPARAILHDIDPNIPPRVRTFAQIYSSSLDARRFSVTLVAIFSMTALLLAVAGIYGVISYSVAQRTREIGVRMALGATTRKVLGMVLRHGAITGGIGIVAGLAGSFVVMRWLQSQLFEVSPTDPLTLAGAAALLVLFSLAACSIPALRAARIDPIIALRCE